MVGIASYPGLGAKGPAALSPEIAQGLLRDRWASRASRISDDLQAGAIEATHDRAHAAAIARRRPGIDLLLFAGTPPRACSTRSPRRSAAGQVDLEAARESCVRVVELREGLAAPARLGARRASP